MRKIDNRSIMKRRRNCIGNQSTEDEIGKKHIGCQVLERPGFAPLVFFWCRRQGLRRAFSRGGNVRREIRGLQPSAANLQHSPKQKSEKLNLTNADIYVAPCVWKSWKSQRKRAGSCVITSVVVNLIKSSKRWNRAQREKCSQENAMKNPKKLRYSVCV